MQKQLGKVGAIRREFEGKACPLCGGHSYQLVLRQHRPVQDSVLAHCRTCQQPTGVHQQFGKVLWI